MASGGSRLCCNSLLILSFVREVWAQNSNLQKGATAIDNWKISLESSFHEDGLPVPTLVFTQNLAVFHSFSLQCLFIFEYSPSVTD